MAEGLFKTQRHLLRIALTGPESTGKSELSEKLAAYYCTAWVPEFARDYVAGLNRPYTLEDITFIACRQFESEHEAAGRASRMLFCDTEATVTKIWALHRFGRCPQWIIDHINSHVYDLYLLCDTDLPWQYDPLREHPHLRKHFFDLYHNDLAQRNAPFTVISGTGATRLANAIQAVDAILHKDK